MSCPKCQKLPASESELPFTDRTDLLSDSHEGLSLCSCAGCGQLFVRYWWETFDDVRRYWVPVSATEADDLRADYSAIRSLVISKSHLCREADGSLHWRMAGSTFGPDFLPPD